MSTDSVNTFMKWVSTRVVTVVFLFAASAVMALGQTVQSAELQGVVTDEVKAIIPGASLTLFNENSRLRDAVSAGDGSFSFGELPFGKYRLVVRKEGFADREIAIELDGRIKGSDLVLSAGAVTESVTVVLDSCRSRRRVHAEVACLDPRDTEKSERRRYRTNP